ncbi:cupin domain-containing protein [Nocardia sp. CDC159]|uniref:Cupin domain-containing protein n=1 Tax=Nocardia pulmonis TaxID=2951408 RepID=A0A9X2EDZ8_9NOCA|nr:MULTISPECIES: cupin domain-containing protein [Nocardia]MCM6776356.1 cupin domain-containing protein [Nocardia pulmonis]MCM6788780.1 cupin domain-containing protein [Nocardia sp. CDC159]
MNTSVTDPTAFGLDWLVHPVSTTTFLESHWETEPMLVQRDDPGYYRELPGLDAIDELITATVPGRARTDDDGRLARTDPGGPLHNRRFRLHGNGIPDLQYIHRSYADGYSVVLNSLHMRSAPIGRLCHALEATLHHRVSTNLYLTPRHNQAFQPHADTHDVFILQLHGVKQWHVGKVMDRLPLHGRQYPANESFARFRTHTLTPGDLLYLPRGFPHEAVTVSSSSLHLTVGIHVYGWLDLLASALRLFAEDDVRLRRALPPGFIGRTVDAEYAAELAEAFAAALRSGALADTAAQQIATHLLATGKLGHRGRFAILDRIPELKPDSVLIRDPAVLCRVRTAAEQSRIDFAGNFVAGPTTLAPAFHFVAEHDRFRVADLPGDLTHDDRIELAARLVAEGLLDIEE